MTRRRAAENSRAGESKRREGSFKRESARFGRAPARFGQAPVRKRRRRVRPRRLPGGPEPKWIARKRMSRRGRNLRAFGAYLDLLDTVGHFKNYLRGQLETFDLTLRGFRMLEMLYRDGTISIGLAAEKLNCSRQNVTGIIERLEKRGWVAREIWNFPAAAIDESRLPVAQRGQPRQGRAIGVVRLTRLGKEFIGTTFPKHAKVVKCMMLALDGREQVTLSRLLQKLREGDARKFLREFRIYDEEDWRTVVKSR
jgi:DNA-binding Lrp family transcriptional regulator